MYSYDYARSVENAGGIPVFLPIIAENEVGNMLMRLDGLLLAGGADINPLYYHTQPISDCGPIEAERDTFELALAKEALEQNMPVLGICRGMQLLNVTMGGSLYQDLQQEIGPECNHVIRQFHKGQGTHQVSLSQGSKLQQALQCIEVMVNSFHHQGLKVLGQGLIATALSHDNLIEGIESKQHSCVWAVQWHPEMMTETNELQQRLFNSFVAEVRLLVGSRQLDLGKEEIA